jgi:hypothetical protein
MLDKEAQQALVALMNTKQHLEDEVLKAMRTPEMTNAQVGTLRKKYLMFLTKLEAIEADLEAHNKGTEADWLAMWKGQKDEDA